MNMQSIIISNTFGMVLLLFLAISRFITRQRRRLEDRLFSTIIWLTVAACIVESISFMIDGRPGRLYYWLNILTNTYLYSANTLGCLCWALFVDMKLYRDRDRLKALLPKYAIVPAVTELALLLNIFGGFLFYVDDQNVYHRTDMAFLLYLAIFFNGAVSVVVYYRFRSYRGKARFFPLWMFLLPVLAGSLAQGLVYGVSVAWPATAIGIAAVHMSMQNEKSYIDNLTGIYNRQYLEHMMWVMQADPRSYYGIMLDMNRFKLINDTYGHSAGDRALRNAAKIMRHCMPISGSVYRFAGDEFIMILQTDSEEDVTAVERRLRAEAQKFNEDSGEPYKISFSLGHAKYEKGESEDEFLKTIDARMYEDKVRMHAAMDAEKIG